MISVRVVGLAWASPTKPSAGHEHATQPKSSRLVAWLVDKAAMRGIGLPELTNRHAGPGWVDDAGWRIDLVCTTEGIARRAVSGVVERPASYQERWSDHAPLTVTFDWPESG
ncbi:hypothetical protein GCM10012275_33070 [Longimycelium tulufanense]|uniref:Uncharacterized protein n=1 Tax=Longimycelium tulufanense TaxID=907463 RepID=A0A8J3CF46_9PSEU|nr:hypothetical protein [Longimycelium tulufanense]GGM59290.1 hypothetical protein GCM10012275_33070 [Longimycelium tulufanense]